MRIFVTGASGFVGGAATTRFVADGHEVRAMSRSEKSDAIIRALGATPVRCDLNDVVPATVGDAEAVLHCAAFVEQWGPRDAWQRINVMGTRAILAAAKLAGAKRFIHISTESVLWRGQHLRNVDETYPRAPNSPYPYAATKAQAEELVERANGDGFEALILRPRFIWGAGRHNLAADDRAGGGVGAMDVGRWRTSSDVDHPYRQPGPRHHAGAQQRPRRRSLFYPG